MFFRMALAYIDVCPGLSCDCAGVGPMLGTSTKVLFIFFYA